MRALVTLLIAVAVGAAVALQAHTIPGFKHQHTEEKGDVELHEYLPFANPRAGNDSDVVCVLVVDDDREGLQATIDSCEAGNILQVHSDEETVLRIVASACDFDREIVVEQQGQDTAICAYVGYWRPFTNSVQYASSDQE